MFLTIQYPDNLRVTKHVESVLIPCLDVGSNPTDSTN